MSISLWYHEQRDRKLSFARPYNYNLYTALYSSVFTPTYTYIHEDTAAGLLPRSSTASSESYSRVVVYIMNKSPGVRSGWRRGTREKSWNTAAGDDEVTVSGPHEKVKRERDSMN